MQLVHGAPPPSDIPHEHAGVVAAGVQPVLDSVPGETLDAATVTLQCVDKLDSVLLQFTDSSLQ